MSSFVLVVINPKAIGLFITSLGREIAFIYLNAKVVAL